MDIADDFIELMYWKKEGMKKINNLIWLLCAWSPGKITSGKSLMILVKAAIEERKQNVKKGNRNSYTMI